MRFRQIHTGRVRHVAALGALAGLLVGPAHAFDFTLGPDVKGNLINQISGGFSQRLRDPDPNLAAIPPTPGFVTGFQDANYGDLNYHKGDLFALYFKGDHELLLNFPDKYKFFARAAWIIDGKANDTRFVPLESPAYVQAAHNLYLYDLWGSKDFDLFGRSARLRVGRQSINWGESLFVAGGVNATAAIDQFRLTYPGVPLKEVVLPAEMVSLAFSPLSGVNVESYYQFRWNANRLVPVGTFFSTSNYIGEGKGPNWFAFYDPRYSATHGGVFAPQSGPNAYTGAPITNPGQALGVAIANNYSFCSAVNVVVAPGGNTCALDLGAPYVAADQRPPLGGEWGISMHYKPEGKAVDLGLYYERFHEKSPYLRYLPTTTAALGVGQQLVYPKDHNLVGASTNVLLGQWAIGSEVSYRFQDPILVDPFSCVDLGFGGGGANCNGNFATYRETGKWQWNTTWWRAVNPSDTDWYGRMVHFLGAQGSNIQGEFALIDYPGVANHAFKGLGLLSDLSFDITSPAASGIDKNAKHFGTATSMGVVQYFDLTYDGTLIPGWQVIPNVTFSFGINGDTPNANYTWFKHVFDTTYALTLTQNLQHWAASLLVVTYRGGAPNILRNFYADRDWWGASVTYTF
jgi:hypothetical protein